MMKLSRDLLRTEAGRAAAAAAWAEGITQRDIGRAFGFCQTVVSDEIGHFVAEWFFKTHPDATTLSAQGEYRRRLAALAVADYRATHTTGVGGP